MKEFSSQTGGRFTYIDDVVNLQELALAFSAVFDDCDNFIVSGCKVTGNTISSGIVYLNGKLRVFNGATGITAWPQYIYEANGTENTRYKAGGEKVGRIVWGCTIGATVPTTATPLTDKIPQSITISANGGIRMKDAWIGKYAVLLDSASSSQTMKGTLTVGNLNAAQVTGSNSLNVTSPAGAAKLYYDGANMVLESVVDGGQTKYQLAASQETGGFSFYKDSSLIATFSGARISFSKPVIGTYATFGSVRISDTGIFNPSTATDSGEVSINVLGYHGADSYYRDTHIGNGKGAKLLSVLGKTSDIIAYGPLSLNSASENGIALISNKQKTDSSLKKLILWQDSSKNTMAKFGYDDANSAVFSLSNTLGAVKIQGQGFVDIGPAIKEGGTLLSEKYVLKSNLDSAIDEKVDAASIYVESMANKNFASSAGGLKQFISPTTPKATLCDEIGALTSADLGNYPTLQNCLSDMATTDDLKKQIRNNIGAAGVGDYQAKLPDTGWVSIGTYLYVRQIGDIVSIQGMLTTVHDGQVFFLPNNISAPRYTVGYDAPLSNNGYWSCKIEGGKKICTVTRCNSHGVLVPICITYMV